MSRSSSNDYAGLKKLAFRMTTVGDVMNAMNADMTMDAFQRRKVIDEINSRRIDVKTPASRLPYLLGGGIAGNIVSRYLGAGGVLRSVGTVVGAAVGNSLYNSRHPSRNEFRGYRIHTY